MKKCPFCKADIEENARFCLYCMKPLNKKEVIESLQGKKRWWIWAVVLIGVIGLALLLPGRESAPSAQTPIPTTEQTTPPGTEADEGVQESSEAEAVITEPETTEKEAVSQQVALPLILPETTGPEQTDPESTKPEPTEPQLTQPEETHPQDPPKPPQAEAEFTYRTARAGDDLNANYVNADNDIVITGIAKPSANGIYHIPSYIDGKRVLAIGANAFHGTNSKIVYVPSTIRNIWNYAFYGCGLTDVYFQGNSIYTESKAFSGSVTIHCSASCSDRNFRLYKNCAASYGAVWEEWNG